MYRMAIALSCRPFNPAGLFVEKGHSLFNRSGVIKDRGSCADWNADFTAPPLVITYTQTKAARLSREGRRPDGGQGKKTANPETMEDRPNGNRLVLKIKTIK